MDDGHYSIPAPSTFDLLCMLRSSSSGMSNLPDGSITNEDERLLPLNVTEADSFEKNKKTLWTRAQVQEACLCAVISYVAWHLPKALFLPTQEQIDSRPLPLMKLPDGQMMQDPRYSHPYVNPPTISSSLLVTTGVYIPFGLVFLYALIQRGYNSNNSKTIFCTLCMAIAISEFLTNVLKFWVRRPRPNFFQQCQFQDGACTAPFLRTLEAQLSFPSGHSSLSFVTCTVMVLWFWTLLRARNANKYFYYLAATPWLWATFCAASRVVDYWHHVSDILAGSILGFSCACIAFSIHFQGDSNNNNN